MKRFPVLPLFLLGVLIAVGLLSAFSALLAMGGIGGTAMGVAPEFTFGLVGGIVCPNGTLDYYSVQRSYHQPGESEPHLDCVEEGRTPQEVLVPAVTAVLGGTFAVVFLILFIPGFLLGAVASFIVVRRTTGPNAAEGDRSEAIP